MKKTFLITICALFAGLASSIRAQQPHEPAASPGPGLRTGVALNWLPLNNTAYVATDINGVKYDFAQILKQGKKVIIDFSTVWCAPCMQVHKSGVLTEFYNRYAQGSADGKAMAFWVEAQGASIEKLQGQNEHKYDWTEGGAFPVPIISDAAASGQLLGIPLLSRVPTLVVIGSDGYYADITTKPELVTLQYLVDAMDMAYGAGEPPKVVLGDMTCVNDFEIYPRAQVRTPVGVATYKWTFEGGTPQTYQGSDPTVTFAQPGEYKMTIEVTDEEGRTTTNTATVTVKPKQDVDRFPYSYPVGEGSLDYNWRSTDADGDGYGWLSAQDFFLQFGNFRYVIDKLAASTPNFLCSWSYMPVQMDYDMSYKAQILSADNYLISPKVTIPADAPNPQFGFKMKSYEASALDECAVLVSTGGFKPADFTQELRPLSATASDDWEQVTLSLAPYKGKTIYLAIRHKSTDKSGLLIDDIEVRLDGLVGIQTPAAELQLTQIGAQVRLWGAPVSSVSVLSLSGTALATYTPGSSNNVTLSLSHLPAGTYILQVMLPDHTTRSFKVVKP